MNAGINFSGEYPSFDVMKMEFLGFLLKTCNPSPNPDGNILPNTCWVLKLPCHEKQGKSEKLSAERSLRKRDN